MSRRLALYLGAAFAITWGAWGTLAALARSDALRYGEPRFMALYILGGLGPMIAAYLAIIATRSATPLREFHLRLLRWRVARSWYLFALFVPIALALASVAIALVFERGLWASLAVRPWYLFAAYFLTTIIGGGLEEPGWRGVAQPELQRWLSPGWAAVAVAAAWAPWHLPLFFIPGVAQYGGSFVEFAIGILGTSLLLGWLYARTQSVLLCVIFHASANASALMGIAVPDEGGLLTSIGAIVNVAAGLALFVLRNPQTGARAIEE